jgi:hypothetical protein
VPLIYELLVPATGAQLAAAGQDAREYDVISAQAWSPG